MARIQALTPEVLIGAPRRSPAVPNRNGTLALYSLSTHDWDSGTTTTKIQVMDLETTQSWLVTAEDGVSDVHWIPGTDDDIIYLRPGPKGTTAVHVTTGAHIKGERRHDNVVEFDAPVANLKLKSLGDQTVAFVVTGLVGEDGQLFNEETVMTNNSGRVYDTVNVRQVRLQR